MNLYLDSGYLDVTEIIQSKYPFIFIIGARGVGKTYGALKHLYENDMSFILLRRTQVQADLISSPAFQPYKQLNIDMGWDVTVSSIAKNVTGIYKHDGDLKPAGFICALSTFSNLRGFDASDIEIIFYDEFIPEKNARPIKMEYETLLNMFETVNRNRELSGRKPVKLVCCANSNSIDNPYFIGMGVVNKIASMQSKGKNIYTDDKRGLMIINLSDSPISRAKKDTALYRLSGDNEFSSMALSNIYTGVEYDYVRPCPIIEHIARVTVGEITIYRHKSSDRFYVSTHRSGSPIKYSSSTDDLERYKQSCKYVFGSAFYEGRMFFEDAISQVLFKKYTL